MRVPGVFEGLLIALAAAALSILSVSVFYGVFGADLASKMVVASLGSAYLLYSLARSRIKTGRMTLFILGPLFLLGLTVLGVSFDIFLLSTVGVIWVVRSLYHYSGLIPAAMDGVLTLFALVWAQWVWRESGSFAFGVWAFFLSQALTCFIPESIKWKDLPQSSDRDEDGSELNKEELGFSRAHRSAESALKQLATR